MKKSFLILMLMALLPMAGFALTLDVSQFSAANINYGSTALPVVDGGTYALNTDYTVDYTHFYTSDAGAGETAVGDAGANLKVANNGKYYIKVLGAGAYDGQTIYVDFWIKGIPVTIDFNAVAKTFGEADADHPITYTLDPVEVTKDMLGLTVSRATGEDAKTYAYSFEWDNKNYTLTRKGGDADVYTINAKNITATAKITKEQGDVVYTGNDIFGAYTVLDKEGGVTLVADKDYTVSAAHNVIANIKPTITFKGNYEGTIDAATGFAVKAAPIVVGVEDIEVTYDGTDKKDQKATALGKLTYAGFVGADLAGAAALKTGFTAAITAATTTIQVATEAIDAKDYDLVINTDAVAGGNYYFAEFVPGKLTIKKANLAIKAKDATKAIGDADPAFTLDYAGALTITGVTFTRESGETAGDYKITPDISAIVVKSGDKTVTANYNITVDENKGKLSIGKTKIYVTIKDAEKFYGAADPEFKYTVTGLNGDELAPFTITREAGEHVGAYSLTATVANPNETKYSEVVVANGIFTIKKAQLDLTFTAAQSVKKNPTDDEKAAALNKSLINVAGINNTDAAADLYNLAYKGGLDFTADKTHDDGVVITLDATKKLITENATDYYVNDLYEIITAKDADGNVTATDVTTNCKLIVGAGTAAVLAFTTADDDADYNLIKAHAGETQDVTLTINNRTRKVPATTTHTWAKETWNTMVLPFEVTVAEISAQLGYAIVNVVDKDATTEGNVQFKLEMQKIPANTPFCVKTSAAIEDGVVTMHFAKKLIVDGGKNPSVDAGMGYKFIGAYENLTIDKNNPTYNFLRGDNAKWAHIGATSANSWTVVPFDAYVELTAAGAARGVTFTFQELDGSYTAIKSVEASVNEKSSVKEGWYNLNGVKMEGAPTQKGIYINNGKKVVIK